MASAFLTSAVACLDGRSPGAARCNGWVVGNDDGSLELVNTGAFSASAS